jgi:hypothetical protein
MYIGSDQLWRLRFKTGDKYHARFWGQTIQFMALSHLLAGSKPVRIETERTEYTTSDNIHIYANVTNDAFEPVTAPSYPLTLERIDEQGKPLEGKPVTLRLEPVKAGAGKGNTPGLYQVYFRPDRAGRYRVTAAVGEGKDPKDVANLIEFNVAAIEREKAQPAMQEAALRKLADLSGGRYFNARELPVLPGLVEANTTTIPVRNERELWDVWAVFALVLGLAGLEWFIRRRSDLV